MERKTAAKPPVCANGHPVAPAYTIEEARSREVLEFHCDICDERWNPSREERDAFLQYLEEHSSEAVPP